MVKKQVNTAKNRTRKSKNAPSSGRIYVHASMNNTIITATTEKGDAVYSRSGGSNYKGARKATPGAAEQAARELGEALKNMGMVTVVVIISGPGPGRDASVKGLASSGLTVVNLIEKTPIPHNGCRRRKARRI